MKIAWRRKNGGNSAWPRSWEWGKRKGTDGCEMTQCSCKETQSEASASPYLLHNMTVSSCTLGQGNATLTPSTTVLLGCCPSMKWLWQGSRSRVLNPKCGGRDSALPSTLHVMGSNHQGTHSVVGRCQLQEQPRAGGSLLSCRSPRYLICLFLWF